MNFQITQGTGTTIATDTGGGGENYQKIKLIDGTPGSTTPVGTSGNPLQISLANTGLNSTPIAVDGSGVTQPISVVSLPLPTGAATETTLFNIETSTNNLDVVLSTRASELTLTGIKSQTDNLTFVASRLLVDGSGVTQPVSISGTVPISGSVTANIGTTGGLALDSSLTGGTAKTRILDSAGIALTSTLVNTKQALDIHQADTSFIVSGLTSVGFAPSLNPVSIAGVDGGGLKRALLMDTSGRIEIDTVQSLPLPTGASTSTNQTNGAQKTQIVDGSGNVIASTSNALNVDVTNTVTVSGTVTANAGTNLNTSALALDTSVNGILLSQGSTTLGEKGPLIQGAVTTAAPSYTTAQTSPLSLNTSGSLRIDNSSWLGSTAPTVGSKTSANSIPVVIASDQGNVAIAPDVTTAVSLTAIAQTAQISMQGHSSIAFTLTSMGSGGVVAVEGSVDGTTWFLLDSWSEANESWSIAADTISVSGTYWVEPVGALDYVRLRVTALSSGTITGTLLASSSVMGTFEFQGSAGTNVPPNIALVGGKTNDATPQFKEIPLSTTGGAVISTLGNSTGKTVVQKTGTLVTTATTADQVVLTYTVTSGKTFYLQYLDMEGSLTTPANTAAVVGAISLENPSGTKVISSRFTNASVGYYSGNGTFTFSEPIPVSSGTVIRVVTTPGVATSCTWIGNFGGYEV